jgi:hypothetical protein
VVSDIKEGTYTEGVRSEVFIAVPMNNAVTANVLLSLLIPLSMMVVVIYPPKHLFLQEPHRATSQTVAFFIVTAVKTSTLFV